MNRAIRAASESRLKCHTIMRGHVSEQRHRCRTAPEMFLSIVARWIGKNELFVVGTRAAVRPSCIHQQSLDGDLTRHCKRGA